MTQSVDSTAFKEIVFIGVGSGAGAGPFSEPASSAELRIHNSAISGGLVHMAVSDPSGLFPGGAFFATKIGDIVDGRYKARVEKVGGNLTFSILDVTTEAVVLDGGTPVSGTLAMPTFLNNTNSRLFFGNAGTKTTYDDMVVTFTPSTLDADGDGVSDADDICPGTVLPDGVPTRRLGVNRWAGPDSNGDFETTAPKGKGPQRSYTIEDTAGCSAAQIIDALGLGKGHTKFGVSISGMDEWVALVNPS